MTRVNYRTSIQQGLLKCAECKVESGNNLEFFNCRTCAVYICANCTIKNEIQNENKAIEQSKLNNIFKESYQVIKVVASKRNCLIVYAILHNLDQLTDILYIIYIPKISQYLYLIDLSLVTIWPLLNMPFIVQFPCALVAGDHLGVYRFLELFAVGRLVYPELEEEDVTFDCSFILMFLEDIP